MYWWRTMRKKRRRINNPSRTNSGRVYKAAYLVAAILFLLVGVLYVAGRFLTIVTPPQQVFASPYLAQNKFANIEKKLNNAGFEIASAKLSPNKLLLTIVTKDDLTILFSAEHELDWQIDSLQKITNKLTIENKYPTQIDFRFEKPIVKF